LAGQRLFLSPGHTRPPSTLPGYIISPPLTIRLLFMEQLCEKLYAFSIHNQSDFKHTEKQIG
jgi:hypothetical protein